MADNFKIGACIALANGVSPVQPSEIAAEG